MKRTMLVLVGLVALLGACSDNSKVGSSDLLQNSDKGTTSVLGQTTTTTAAPTTTTTAPKGASTTQRTTTTKPQQAAITVKIGDDAKGPAFQPSVAQVLQGSVVRWVNEDTGHPFRSVVFDDESVNSGNIPPGGHFDYTATRPGTINYHDGTRPYAVAQLQVVAH